MVFKNIYLIFFGILSLILGVEAIAQTARCAEDSPEHKEAVAIYQQLVSSRGIPDDVMAQLVSRYNVIADRAEQLLNGSHPVCLDLNDYESKLAPHDRDVAEQLAAAAAHLVDLEAYNAQCNNSSSESCVSWANEINARAQRINEWGERINNRKSLLDVEQTNLNNKIAKLNGETLQLTLSFIKDAQAAIPKGFTGKKIYRLAAKSWINGRELREFSIMKWKINLSTNDEPFSPELTDRFDYKLYQAFTAEVVFQNGKIISADIVPYSADQRANTTLGLAGAVKVVQEEFVIAADGLSARFRRTVEARPNLLIVIPDISLLGNLKPIDNTLYLTVTAETATAKGEGSAFPSHKFWIREGTSDKLIESLVQVQPSEYFHY